MGGARNFIKCELGNGKESRNKIKYSFRQSLFYCLKNCRRLWGIRSTKLSSLLLYRAREPTSASSSNWQALAVPHLGSRRVDGSDDSWRRRQFFCCLGIIIPPPMHRPRAMTTLAPRPVFNVLLILANHFDDTSEPEVRGVGGGGVEKGMVGCWRKTAAVAKCLSNYRTRPNPQFKRSFGLLLEPLDKAHQRGYKICINRSELAETGVLGLWLLCDLGRQEWSYALSSNGFSW